jgi:Tfp pilus assembly protein PilZ
VAHQLENGMLFVTTGQTFTIGGNSEEALLLLGYQNQSRSWEIITITYDLE